VPDLAIIREGQVGTNDKPSSRPGAQPIQSGAASRHPAGLQGETLDRIDGLARPRGIDRRLRAGVPYASTRAVTLTTPSRGLLAARPSRRTRRKAVAPQVQILGLQCTEFVERDDYRDFTGFDGGSEAAGTRRSAYKRRRVEQIRARQVRTRAYSDIVAGRCSIGLKLSDGPLKSDSRPTRPIERNRS
jgi:hypothetical protein